MHVSVEGRVSKSLWRKQKNRNRSFHIEISFCWKIYKPVQFRIFYTRNVLINKMLNLFIYKFFLSTWAKVWNQGL